jgi:hypothetical protein
MQLQVLLNFHPRLARAYNLVIPPSGRTLSGGLDPASLHKPKAFFGLPPASIFLAAPKNAFGLCKDAGSKPPDNVRPLG